MSYFGLAEDFFCRVCHHPNNREENSPKSDYMTAKFGQKVNFFLWSLLKLRSLIKLVQCHWNLGKYFFLLWSTFKFQTIIDSNLTKRPRNSGKEFFHLNLKRKQFNAPSWICMLCWTRFSFNFLHFSHFVKFYHATDGIWQLVTIDQDWLQTKLE